jgi:ribonucleotide reductase alpha subunit
MQELRVTKRDNTLQIVSFDKILIRVKQLCEMSPEIKSIPLTTLVMKIIDQLYDKISTKIIDELTAEQCAIMTTHHPEYGILASRIITSNHHKNTTSSFFETIDGIRQQNSLLIDDSLYRLISENRELIESKMDYSRDYLIDYFGFKTLERSYLLKVKNTTNDVEAVVQERVQHVWMRVSLSIHGKDLDSGFKSYDLMSQKMFTHATPTLFNAGSSNQQLSSCFLLTMETDSVDGIYSTLTDCARISKWSGGIGLDITQIRGKSSLIKSTNGLSNGIVPMLKLFNDTSKFINQSGKRNGSIAIYLEPWHTDIFDFLELKKNHGDDEMRCRDLFYGLWIPDLFMQRVSDNDSWSIMSPDNCPGLSNVYGQDFEDLYQSYENNKMYTKVVSARELWFKILDAQMETGNPYLLYKDSVNEKSNQKNLGTIKSSNLCCEVTLYTDEKETAVCNLASIALPSFVKGNQFDFEKLHEVTKIVTGNLNRVIDINFYPTSKAKRSNLLHRPIGIGVQGLADTFMMLNLPFTCSEAKLLNKQIFETIYHAALERSNELAMERVDIMESAMKLYIEGTPSLKAQIDQLNPEDEVNWFHDQHIIKAELMAAVTQREKNGGAYNVIGAYSSFNGSPTSLGILQYDLWNKRSEVETSESRYDWGQLKQKIEMYGLRNSTLLSPMPTASTSQILGFTECFEPLTSNLYSRHTLAGEFMVTNKYFIQEMIDLGVWSEEIRNNIIKNRGSVQQLNHLVDPKILEKYKTVWELPMKDIVDMSADRAIFICQSQSLNLWMEDPNYRTLTSMHFYAWKKGLKTGIYYLRRKGKHQAQQFTIEPTAQAKIQAQKAEEEEEQEEREQICEMCMA